MADARPIVVTGGAGFIGRALCNRLAARGLPIRALLRRAETLGPGIETIAVGTLGPDTDWPPLLDGAGTVVHLAGRAHRPAGAEDWIAEEAETARRLAQAASRAGVSRLVLMSSIKVMGETSDARPFRADQAPAPEDAYGRAKQRIEEAMREATADLVVLRPPLVYGPGVGANFRALLGLVARGLPLPFASIANRRAFIALDNLLDLIELCLSHEAAPGGTFLLRDDEEVSTPELIRRIARQLHRPARLFPCPPALLRGAAQAAGRGAATDRLTQSLRIDDGPTREVLGWRPRFSLDEGLGLTCRWFAGGDSRSPDSPL